jgi:hypothetical protein
LRSHLEYVYGGKKGLSRQKFVYNTSINDAKVVPFPEEPMSQTELEKADYNYLDEEDPIEPEPVTDVPPVIEPEIPEPVEPETAPDPVEPEPVQPEFPQEPDWSPEEPIEPEPVVIDTAKVHYVEYEVGNRVIIDPQVVES